MGRGIARLTICLLDPLLLPALAVALQVDQNLELGDQRGRIRSVAWCEADDPEASSISWTDLEAQARATFRIQLDFLTPTFFRQGNGKQAWSLPLPDPSAIVGSMERHWLTWCGRLPSGWQTGAVPVQLDSARIETRMIHARTQMVGFVGRVSLSLIGANHDQALGFNALIQAAPYTGIGAKTAYGFGRVAVVDEH